MAFLQSGKYLFYHLSFSLFNGLILGLLLLLIIIAIYFYIKFREQKLLQDKKQLEETVKKRTKEIMLTEKELHNTIALNQSIISNAKDGIVVFDMEGNFIMANEAFLKMTLYSRADLMGVNYKEITPQDWLLTDREQIKKLVNDTPVYYEKELVKQDGERLPVTVSAALIRDDYGTATSFMAIITDNTERKKNEREIEQHKLDLEKLVEERTVDLKIAKEKAEQSDKLKSAFLANMSHEIRTPMNAIVGFSELLLDDDISAKERKEFVYHINDSCQSLLLLINDIIDMSKIEIGDLDINLNPCDVHRILDELYNENIEMKRKKGKSEIELKISKPNGTPDEFLLVTDPERFKQVLSKLISNGIKYTDEGYVEYGYSFEDRNNEKVVRFFVKDTGIGISKNKQTSIFDNFMKIEDNKTRLYSGTGLGLSISKSLINLLGGEMWIKSKPQEGSTFFFTLPYRTQK